MLLVAVLSVLSREGTSHTGEPATLQVVIPSGFGSIERRQACRATWLKWIEQVNNASISYSFHVEAPLTELEREQINDEAEKYNDIVLMKSAAPRNTSLESCSFRRWEALSNEYKMNHKKVDYYVMADDDSFICIHHLLSDSKYWPDGKRKRVHISHFRQRLPDVISIYSNLLVKDGLKYISTKQGKKHKYHPLVHLIMNGPIKNVDSINDPRLTFGARGYDKGRYNDFTNGWVGADLLNSTEKASICNNVLALHQAYPDVATDLWKYVGVISPPEVYQKPMLSRNIVDLDNTVGYD